MHPALSLLLKLRGRARWRRMIAGMKTVKGAMLVIVTGLFFGCMILPNLLLPIASSFSEKGRDLNAEMVKTAHDRVLAYAPLVLLAFSLAAIGTSMGEAAIYFSPAEVDFLFAAPFSRRELLLFKLRQSVRNALFAGTLFAVVTARFSASLLNAWLACVLTLLFMNALTLALTLLGQLITERAYSQSRRMILIAAVILIGLGLWQALLAFEGRGPLPVAKAFAESPAGRVLLAPFTVFPRIMVAESLAGAAPWAAIAAAMIVGLFALAISLDVNYLETAQHVSQRVYERLQRRRAGGGAISAVTIRGATRLRLPRLPWLWGVGPNLWRQELLLLRRSQGLMLIAVLMLVVGGFLAFNLREAAAKSEYLVPGLILGGLAYQSLLASMQLPTGFRGDLDRLDWLKSLPLRGPAIVCGQISGAAVLLSLFQALILIAAWAFFRRGHEVFVAGLVFLLPINWLIFGVENLVFLLFPYRQAATTAGDFQFVGKFLLISMLKAGLSCLGLTVAAAGGILYLIVPSLWFPLTGSLLLLLAIDGAVLYAASLAFERFDVSLHTPA